MKGGYPDVKSGPDFFVLLFRQRRICLRNDFFGKRKWGNVFCVKKVEKMLFFLCYNPLMKIRLVSPTAHKEIDLNNTFLWSLLFGPFYFAYVGIWDSAILAFILAVFSGGISVLIYPFFAEKIIVQTYLKKGWKIKNSS